MQAKIQKDNEVNRILMAQSLLREYHQMTEIRKLADAEFRVFSNSGEDGIIQYLISKVPIENEVFVEFGVQDYQESNTRFLLINNNWRGLLIDRDRNDIQKIRELDLYYRHDVTAINAFITKDNINDLIRDAGIQGDIGLLSIDIDGNDYWVWKAIEVISPRIAVIEYNSVFGIRLAMTIPHDEYFDRTKAHHSNLYYGASLKALCRLAEEKGYLFVGSNSMGCNAFFVRKDVAGNVTEVECENGYIESKIRESRNRSGVLTFVSGEKRLKLIEDQMVYDVENNTTKRLKDVLV